MTPTLIIITLVLVGILMMLIEFLLTPGMGFAGIIGLASFVGACVYAFIVEGTQTGTVVTAVVAVIVIILFIWMLRGKTWKKLEQQEQIDVKTNTEVEKVKVGDKGVTLSRLVPIGKVKFDGVTCEVHNADGSFVDPGVEVEVTAVEDNEVFVKPIK
ncbi:MAG: NfeD family protein [Bacteroidales bacterium]|nr:NfeD family protein [Bacteroidales bacterium]MBR3500954.1 NfeD family protein [Bacteroidales bacterium]